MIENYKYIIYYIQLFLINESTNYEDNEIQICFPSKGVYKNYFPPKLTNTTESEEIYSVSNSQRISRPIVAYLCAINRTPIRKNYVKQNLHSFTITSEPFYDVSGLLSTECVSDLPNAIIQFCQYSANEYDLSNPRKFYRNNLKEICTKEGPLTRNLEFSLPIPIHGKWLIAQGLSHNIYNISNIANHTCILRRIKFSIPERNITAYTRPFKIYTRTAELQWLEPNGEYFEVFANHPFNITLQIVDGNNKRIESGLDSSLIVEVAIRFQTKTFSQEALVQDFVFTTTTELAGEEVITSKRNYDHVLHKRAKQGLVTFTNVRIRDVDEEDTILLNATLLVPRTGERQPRHYNDFDKKCVVTHELATPFTSSDYCDYLRQDCKELHGIKHAAEYKLYSFTDLCDAEIGVNSIKQIPLKILEQTAFELHVLREIIGDGDGEAIFEDGDTEAIYVTSHFQIPGLWVIVVDNANRRIYSGLDSELIIQVTTDPENISLTDSVIKTHRGSGSFLGAVKEVDTTVRFQFNAIGNRNKTQLISEFSHAYIVTGDIDLALYCRLNSAGDRNDPDPVLASFSSFAIEDINNRRSEFKNSFTNLAKLNISINLKIFDTEQSYIKTVDLFMDQLQAEGQRNGKGVFNGIIGFGSDDITHRMNALISYFNMPLIIYREQWKEFIRKDSYNTLISIGWNILHFTIYAGYLFQKIWNYLIVIQDADKLADYDYYLGIYANFKFTIAYSFKVGNQTNLTAEITAAKKTGARYIHHLVYAPKQYFLFREAIRLEFAPMHGYQWTAIETAGKQFDWEDKHPYCAMKPTCTEAFEGMYITNTMHNLSGYSSPLWYHLNRKYYEMNPAEYYGMPTSRSVVANGAIALGYDAVLSYAHAFEKQLRGDRAITKQSTVEAFRGLEFEGLTGMVRYSPEGGFRMGSINGGINIVAHNRSNSGFSDYYTHNLIRWMRISDYHESFMVNYFSRKKRNSKYLTIFHKQNLATLRQVIEIPVKSSEIQKKMYRMKYMPRHIPNESRLVARFYLSTRGYVSHNAKFISDNETENLHIICLRTEIITAAFYCNNSCSGGRLYSDSATEFKHGVCVSPNECRCRAVDEISPKPTNENMHKIGYTGEFCQNIICSECLNGKCVAPYNCSCFAGWTGYSCNIPECPDGCIYGTCTEPNYCKCYVGYYGSSCSTLLGVIFGGCLCGFAIIFFASLFLFRWRKKKKAVEYAYSNLDWLVNWKDVSQTDVVLSGLITPLTPTQKIVENKTNMYTERAENIVHWKENICYAQKFHCQTLNINDLSIRKEIMHLREIRHPNLVRFIGACLVAPNVALLLELVPKGSLFEIFQNDSYKLSWNFKLSILTDIARGMEYLHNSNIHSHGHLKSTNCLIDNRWACKVTGFGVPTIRNISSSIEVIRAEQISMLWTAPEILRDCATPVDIGVGSKSGDVYSFGIIVTEMCTHKRPFFYELEILSIEELIRLLRNFHDPANRGIKKLLDAHNYDTFKPIRPDLIVHSRMPDSYEERGGIRDLIIITTAEDAFLRPSFSLVIAIINKIRPLKGELIENLIYMLEKYTYHLKELFADKVREVETEKNKTEELLDRLLPPSIAERLALNLEVPPVKYNNVTIFYSDIVGFTTIAKASQPMDVVELLNDLYTCFDSIIERFDAYKLETIGDAYCVASGVPTPSHNHAQEIATMGLFILSAVNNFPIRHMPEKKLEIRIGMHSGSCVAGIVGIKMPRYCIFGHDVLIAQFMESSGLPNAIQVSEITAKILSSTGAYYLAYRNDVEIKFVGNVATYWLIGKDGLEMEMVIPKEIPASGRSSTRSSWGSAISKRRRKSEKNFFKNKMSDLELVKIKDSEDDVYIDDFESGVSELKTDKDEAMDAEDESTNTKSSSPNTSSLNEKIKK